MTSSCDGVYGVGGCATGGDFGARSRLGCKPGEDPTGLDGTLRGPGLVGVRGRGV